MNRAREMCGRKVTTMTVRHPYCAAKRRRFSPFPFRCRRIRDKAMQVKPGVRGRTIIRQPRVIRPVRVGHHHLWRPTLLAELEAVRVSAISFPAQDEDRVCVPQRIDLRSHVDRQPADHSRDQQQANGYHHPSDATAAPGITS